MSSQLHLPKAPNGNTSCALPKKKTMGRNGVEKSSSTGTKDRPNLQEPPFCLYKNPSEPSFSEGLESIIQLLKGRKNIIVLTGAGISVSCGIPDFRSRGSGLYSTLDTEGLGLSCAEELFDWEVFQENPEPFFKFARNLYFPLGNNERVRPSDSHKLLALLEQKKMLLRVYSQNIDGLEQVAGVSPKKVVYAHGSLQWATCCRCKQKMSAKDIEEDILNGTVARCRAPVLPGKLTSQASSREPSARSRKRERPVDELVCGGVLKPGVTFFGEALHDHVRKSLEADRDKVDALIVIGTSLSVAPISKVIGYLPPSVPRILINRTVVQPTHGFEPDDEDDDEQEFRDNYVWDACLLGFCDDVTRALNKELFATSTSENPIEIIDKGKLLACVSEDDEFYDQSDWHSIRAPPERVFLFPGAQAPVADDSSVLTYKEVAHCDGCSELITGTVQKCVQCFDYDLCTKCFPKLSKQHYDGKHPFSAEPSAIEAK